MTLFFYLFKPLYTTLTPLSSPPSPFIPPPCASPSPTRSRPPLFALPSSVTRYVKYYCIMAGFYFLDSSGFNSYKHPHTGANHRSFFPSRRALFLCRPHSPYYELCKYFSANKYHFIPDFIGFYLESTGIYYIHNNIPYSVQCIKMRLALQGV